MSNTVRGMVVYHRQDYRRGVVTAGNQFTGMIAVQWDDGTKQLINVQGLMSEKLYNEFKEEEKIKAANLKEEERVKAMSLKPEQAIIGAVVYAVGNKGPLAKGKIAGPLDNTHGNNLVIVEWDNGQLDKRQIKSLLSELDGAIESKRLLDKAAKLEQEFAEVEKACKDKLQKAAKLVREAAKLASDKDIDLQEMSEATGDLEYAMEEAGWRTSSWHC